MSLGSGSLQEQRLGTASAMGDFSLASSGDVFVDLNTQRASKWKLRPHEKDCLPMGSEIVKLRSKS